LHVTIEETDEGTLICLLLTPSETSSELRDFATSLSGPRARRPSASSTGQRIVSRSEEPPRPPSLVAGDVSPLPPRQPSADSLIRGLEESIRKRKRVPISDLLRLGSRGIASALPFVKEPTLSAAIAGARGESIAEVHVRLAAPLLGLPGIGGDLTKALTGDFERLALEGRENDLVRIGNLITNQMELIRNLPVAGLPARIAMRAPVQVQNLQRLAKAAELNRAKAQQIEEDQ